MAFYKDLHGTPIFASNQSAIEHLDEGILAICIPTDASSYVKKAVDLDQEMPMARIIYSYMSDPSSPDGLSLLNEARAIIKHHSSQFKPGSREELYIDMLTLLSKHHVLKATEALDEIIASYPSDLFALALSNEIYYNIGNCYKIKDSIAGVFPYWKEHLSTSKGFSFVCGMYGFGLEECNLFDYAEKIGRKAVELNPYNAWGNHCIAHCMEMQGRTNEGIEFMELSRPKWINCGFFSSHMSWHHCLFLMELEKYDQVLQIYDKEIKDNFITHTLCLVDAASLLFRLHMTDTPLENRWNHVVQAWNVPERFEMLTNDSCRLKNHSNTWNDTHLMMTTVGAKEDALSARVIESVEQFVEETKDADYSEVSLQKKVGIPILKAMVYYGNKEYAKAADILNSIRYDVRNIGGSNAQRDLYELLLMNCALKGGKGALSRKLASQRLETKPQSQVNIKFFDLARNLSQ